MFASKTKIVKHSTCTVFVISSLHKMVTWLLLLSGLFTHALM